MNEIEQILNDSKSYILKSFEDLVEAKLNEFFSEIDHVCYRVESVERYELLKKQFEVSHELLSDALVNGRPISTFKLNTPIKLENGIEIPLFELPSPKPGSDYKEGFEHIEVVTNCTLDQLIETRTDIKFNLKNKDASINADISAMFKNGLVKFHEQSLEKVIEEENKCI